MALQTRHISCVVSLLGALMAAAPSAHTQTPNYRLEITPRGPDAVPSVVMTCSENSLCRGQVEVLMSGKREALTVSALFEPGNAIIKFDADKTPLFIDQQRYRNVALGTAHVGHATLMVNVPTRAALEDTPNSLVVRPVIRAPAAFVATIDVDIRPSD